jgi:carbamoyltransferase
MGIGKISVSKISLGIHIGHDSGVSLVKDGVLVNSICQERLSRLKHDGYDNKFPKKSLDYILSTTNTQLDNIDNITYSICTQYDNEEDYNELKEKLNSIVPIKNTIKHHTAHVISTYDFFGLKEEAVGLVVDMGGSIFYKNGVKAGIEAHTIFDINQTEVKTLYQYKTPNKPGLNVMYSLGAFYECAGDSLELGTFNTCSGKLMGLSGYGNEKTVKEKWPESYINIPDDLNGEISFKFKNWNNDYFSNFPPSFPTSIKSDNDKADFSLKIQMEFEKAIMFLVKKAKYLKNCDTLVLAGGCFLNSIVNQKIIDSKIFNNIYIIPATDDSGISIGCAFYGYRKIQ